MKRKNNAFSRWFFGEEDVLLGRVEMKPQTVCEPEEGEIRERMREKDELKEQIYEADNAKLKLFKKMYNIAAVIFCVTLISILLVNVSWLPHYGDSDNPVNNEVSARYIESGLQETGAVNIVTGMILDYRAFDTFGESNVLFIATITVLILMRLDPEKKAPAKKGVPVYQKPEDELTFGAHHHHFRHLCDFERPSFSRRRLLRRRHHRRGPDSVLKRLRL